MYRLIAILHFVFILTSCSLLSPAKPVKTNSYLLNSLPSSIAVKYKRPITLLVIPTTARPIYNTTQMAYHIKPYQINYYAKNQWAETPAQMLHSLLIRSLQKTQFFQAVVAPPYMGKYDYALNSQIIELQQDIIHLRIKLIVQVQINKISVQKVIGSRLFVVEMPIIENTPYAGVMAANKAEAVMLREIIKFCFSKIH